MRSHDSAAKKRVPFGWWVTRALIFSLLILVRSVSAHPLGNFTVNHFSRLEIAADQVRLRFIVDMAEIPAFQELQAMGAATNGKAVSKDRLDAYLNRATAGYADNLFLVVDGERVRLTPGAGNVSLPSGAGGLPTLRTECEFIGTLPSHNLIVARERQLHFQDSVHPNRTGWHEIFVVPAPGISIFNSSAFGNSITDELKSYPQDLLSKPLEERVADLSFTRGVMPVGAHPLQTRDGRTAAVKARDPLAELIAVPEVTLKVALLGLLVAAALGAAHAFSPGHGKTVVGAYLVGSRGTPRHALFLGLTVTVTHTAGVIALGLLTLFASQYIVPERLFPVLSFLSGAMVVAIGLSLFVRRLRSALGFSVGHSHPNGHSHDHPHSHGEETPEPFGVHSHGGRPHSHLPPGTDGGPITWRSLLALGVSGGLLPCPSALVVLLAAISLQRVGYGLLLVLAFSIGLAATLSVIGLTFLYAGRFVKLSPKISASPILRALPVASAFVIACLGVAVCYGALSSAGFHLFASPGASAAATQTSADASSNLGSMGALAVLGLGLIFGLKHATEVDHVIAVSTIVSEHRNIVRAGLVGGLWGIGHTASLVVVGAIVLALRIAIPESIAHWLEFGVALMIIGLGVNALYRALRRREGAHLHTHMHDGIPHSHLHFHEDEARHELEHGPRSHVSKRIGLKPLLVGAMHGLAGSAALTLLVLAQISSALLGMVYLAVFGFGSIVGMLLMSGLVGLPFAFTARKLTGLHHGLQTAAGLLSIAFGLWYAYQTGIANALV